MIFIEKLNYVRTSTIIYLYLRYKEATKDDFWGCAVFALAAAEGLYLFITLVLIEYIFGIGFLIVSPPDEGIYKMSVFYIFAATLILEFTWFRWKKNSFLGLLQQLDKSRLDRMKVAGKMYWYGSIGLLPTSMVVMSLLERFGSRV